MPPFRRVGRPGLIGTAARTAVIAGTATAVHGKMTSRQQQKAAEAQAQQAPAPAPPQQAPAPEPAEAAPAAENDVVSQIKELAALHTAGVLSDAEFEAGKAKLLG